MLKCLRKLFCKAANQNSAAIPNSTQAESTNINTSLKKPPLLPIIYIFALIIIFLTLSTLLLIYIINLVTIAENRFLVIIGTYIIFIIIGTYLIYMFGHLIATLD